MRAWMCGTRVPLESILDLVVLDLPWLTVCEPAVRSAAWGTTRCPR